MEQVKKIHNNIEVGKYYDRSHYHHIYNQDIDVFDEKDNFIFCLRKNTIPIEIQSCGYVFEKVAQKTRTEHRKIASGRTPVSSFIAGYYDKPNIRIKDPNPCRLTSFSKNHLSEWKTGKTLVRYIDYLYAHIFPKQYEIQKSYNNKYSIDDTIFSTITINYNWRTATHIDVGDLGFSAFTIVERGNWDGCYLGFPEYGVAANVRQGDILIMNPHLYHCNTEFVNLNDNDMRMSFVFYLREGLLKCK
jgi:hypothetical protein